MEKSNKEDPVYCLISSYNSAALQHMAVITGLIVAIFAYMGLSLKGNNPSWGIGSLAILTVLSFLIMYNLGRAHYYSCLTSLLRSREISLLFSPTLFSVSEEIQRLLDSLAERRIKYKITLQFKRSFSLGSLILAFLAGLAIAMFLLGLGYLVLSFEGNF
jgi:hypothetical protein